MLVYHVLGSGFDPQNHKRKKLLKGLNPVNNSTKCGRHKVLISVLHRLLVFATTDEVFRKKICQYNNEKIREKNISQAWLYTSVIKVTWEAETGGSWFGASLGKKLTRPYFNKQARHGGTCL
jgi:hypothetical protein